MPFPRHKKFRRTSSLLPVCVRRTNQHIRLHLCCCFRGVDLRFSEAQNKLLVEIQINKITRKRRKVWTDSTVGWGVEVVEVGGCGGGGCLAMSGRIICGRGVGGGGRSLQPVNTFLSPGELQMCALHATVAIMPSRDVLLGTPAPPI